MLRPVDDLYLGTWNLIPELCLYDEGFPPVAATYVVSNRGGVVRVRVSWRTRSGMDQAAEYAGPDDGQVLPMSGLGGVTSLSITRVDERTLDSQAWVDDAVVSAARRVASRDGGLLVVQQQVHVGGGGTGPRSYQVYRRGTTAPPAGRAAVSRP